METAQLDVKIAQRIAAHKGVDVATLDPPLQKVIDIDALEKLIQPLPHERTEFTGVVSFDYCDITVTVDQTGAVSVTPAGTDDHQSDNADELADNRVIFETH